MDDCGENMSEEGTVSRYGHSLTPDEQPVILDKKGDDYAPWSTSHSHLKYSPNFKSHSPSQVGSVTPRELANFASLNIEFRVRNESRDDIGEQKWHPYLSRPVNLLLSWKEH